MIYVVIDSDGNRVTKTIDVVVVTKNKAPVITAKNKTILVGDRFDPLKVVTAKDAEDGDLTKKITVIKNTIDPKTPVKYTVIYQVKDSQGSSTELKISITVKKGLPRTGVADQSLLLGFSALIIALGYFMMKK